MVIQKVSGQLSGNVDLPRELMNKSGHFLEIPEWSQEFLFF